MLRWVSLSAPLRLCVLAARPDMWADPAVMGDYDAWSAQRDARVVVKLLRTVRADAPHLDVE